MQWRSWTWFELDFSIRVTSPSTNDELPDGHDCNRFMLLSRGDPCSLLQAADNQHSHFVWGRMKYFFVTARVPPFSTSWQRLLRATCKLCNLLHCLAMHSGDTKERQYFDVANAFCLRCNLLYQKAFCLDS